jgi:lysophospholipase L1-like esterase
MVVSVSDKSCNLDGTMSTIPSLPLLVSIQEELAKNHHTAFWNLYEEMGGSGTMVKWAESDTAMANKDYTHLNFRGARWVARALYNRLVQASQNNPTITTTRIH